MAERNEVDQHLAEGKRLMVSKFYDRAMVEFNKALKLDSKITMRALDGMFETAEYTNDYEGVISIGTNMLLNQPNNNMLANKLGNAYRKMKNFGQAIKLYEHCIKHSPDDKFAPYNWAAAMARIDLYDGAAVSAVLPFERMSRPKLPKNEKGVERLTTLQQELIEAAEARAAAEEAKAAAEAGGDDWQTEMEKKLKAEQKKKKNRKVQLIPEELFDHLRRDKTVSTKAQQTMLKDLSIFCLEKNYPEIAWRAITRLIFQIPHDEDLQSFVALTYDARGEEQLAIDKLLSLLGKDQYNRFANVNLGYLYKKQGNDLLSKKYFLTTHQLLEKSQHYYDMNEFRMKGEQYLKDEVYKNALKVFEVLREEKEAPIILYRLGEIYLALDDYEKALEVYKCLVENYREEEGVEEKLVQINQHLLSMAKDLMADHRYSRAAGMFEMSLAIIKSKDVIENAMSAYKLLRDEEGEKRMKIALRLMEEEEREKEIKESRIKKLKQAKKLEAENLSYKAIQAYEEALRLKPEKKVLIRLLTLYKKTRQPEMMQDVAERYNKALERIQRLADLKAAEANQ